jgi:DNA (cytosine-5)-methyltransferase 1
MTHLGLFEGIGGFSLAARWAGWETIAWCEWNEFGQKVLRHHFPEATGHGDITKTDFTIYANKIDVLTGGFPCQPYSTAGKRLGKDDERHLWPEMLRAIREIQPRWVVGENVRGLVNWNGGMVFDEVQADLEACGYEVLPFILPACAKDAPHRRDRVWFVAYRDKCSKGSSRTSGETQSNGGDDNDEQKGRGEQAEQRFGYGNVCGSFTDTINNGLEHHIQPRTKDEVFREEEARRQNGSTEQFESIKTNGLRGITADTNGTSSQTWSQRQILGQSNREKTNGHRNVECTNQWQNFPTQPPVCGGDDGIPRELDSITFSKWRNESIKAYGNAIVPQVAYEIFKAINEYEPI